MSCMKSIILRVTFLSRRSSLITTPFCNLNPEKKELSSATSWTFRWRPKRHLSCLLEGYWVSMSTLISSFSLLMALVPRSLLNFLGIITSWMNCLFLERFCWFGKDDQKWNCSKKTLVMSFWSRVGARNVWLSHCIFDLRHFFVLSFFDL